MAASPMVYINGTPVFEGSRRISKSRAPVGEVHRSIDGSLHLDVSDDLKLRIELRWDYLPGTISGYLGRDDLKALYEAMAPVTVRVYENASSFQDYQMIIPPGEYSEAIAFRAGGRWVWSVSVRLEEI